MSSKITCYLDSQDYSVLTDPKLESQVYVKMKADLLYLARSKQVRFGFSGAAISETVALTPESSRLAELKAEFLVELCEDNALVSLDKLAKAELNALASRTDSPLDMFDPEGRWFTDITVDESPRSVFEMMQDLAKEEMRTMGLSRQQRRAKSRALFKNGKPRSELRAHINRQDPNILAMDLVKKYPMRPEYAEIIGRYALGKAKESEFTEALANSLKDVHWMMKWFTTQHALSSPIAEIIRKPGRELGQALRSLVDASLLLASTLKVAEIDPDPTQKDGTVSSRWREMEQRQLVSIIQPPAASWKINLGDYEYKDVDYWCPGLSTCIRAIFSSVWDSVGGGRKELPSDSQPVDALHAVYAPYVDIFRADRFMAPHIQKQVRGRGTVVVPRLSQLIKEIENQLL
ncbi:MAG: hypothetical protein AB7E55_29570 [Pigmentiphaga sp.]